MSAFRLTSTHEIAPDDMPEEIVQSLMSRDHSDAIAVFVFAPVMLTVAGEGGTAMQAWECSALVVYRGKLSQNRIVRGMRKCRQDDSLAEVAREFGDSVSAIINEALGVTDE